MLWKMENAALHNGGNPDLVDKRDSCLVVCKQNDRFVDNMQAEAGQADMANEPDGFEEAARIVEAFAEGEADPRVLEMLADLAKAIRERAVND